MLNQRTHTEYTIDYIPRPSQVLCYVSGLPVPCTRVASLCWYISGLCRKKIERLDPVERLSPPSETVLSRSLKTLTFKETSELPGVSSEGMR